MKLWLDDERKPPDNEWTWVKNLAEAIEATEDNLAEIIEMDLDHDLGPGMLEKAIAEMKYDGRQFTETERDEIYSRSKEENGFAFVKWMCETKNLPPNIAQYKVHSWNVPASERMVSLLRSYGCEAIHIPFTVTLR